MTNRPSPFRRLIAWRAFRCAVWMLALCGELLGYTCPLGVFASSLAEQLDDLSYRSTLPLEPRPEGAPHLRAVGHGHRD